MLELHEPEGAFDRIEGWLRERGFFAPGGEDLVADLYLGYGLSTLLRRRAGVLPGESCRLPLAACAVRPPRDTGVRNDNGAETAIGDWERTWAEADHADAVQAVRTAIARGDVYQVNLVQHLSASFSGRPAALAARLANLTRPSRWPFGDDDWRLLEGDGWAIVSASPELFLARRGGRVWTRPIKGTRPRGGRRSGPATGADGEKHWRPSYRYDRYRGEGQACSRRRR